LDTEELMMWFLLDEQLISYYNWGLSCGTSGEKFMHIQMEWMKKEWHRLEVKFQQYPCSISTVWWDSIFESLPLLFFSFFFLSEFWIKIENN
jgi:hypothetical protein